MSTSTDVTVTPRKSRKLPRATDSRGRPVKGLYLRDGHFIAGAQIEGRWTLHTLKADTLTDARRERESWIAGLREGRIAQRDGATFADLFAEHQESRNLSERTRALRLSGDYCQGEGSQPHPPPHPHDPDSRIVGAVRLASAGDLQRTEAPNDFHRRVRQHHRQQALGGQTMKVATGLAVLALALVVVVDGLAKPPRGAIRGVFTIGILAQGDDLTKYMRWSNVWCVWRGDHVIVHVSAKNTAAEHVTTTIQPRYYIRRGGVHGNGVLSTQDKGFDAGEFRSLWLDAGKPKGVPAKTPISRCAPSLFSIKSG